MGVEASDCRNTRLAVSHSCGKQPCVRNDRAGFMVWVDSPWTDIIYSEQSRCCRLQESFSYYLQCQASMLVGVVEAMLQLANGIQGPTAVLPLLLDSKMENCDLAVKGEAAAYIRP